MNKFLRIASPGLVDPMSLTIVGVGASRYSGRSDVIGQFSSGSKLAATLLLRKGLAPTIITGNLRMAYGVRWFGLEGRRFGRVTVTYGGKDAEGKSRSTTEDRDYTTDWGEADWDDTTMGCREYVANGIDAILRQGLSLDELEITLVDTIRAKAGWTQVYIPVDADVLKFYHELDTRFLHFKRKDLLERKLLPKVVDDGKTRIYKKGVLVKVLNEPSVFDYNLGEELRLDESRNASSWDVKYAMSKALSAAPAGDLAVVIKAVATAGNRAALVETSLSADDLKDRWNDDTKVARQERWQEAFRLVAGVQGVASAGLAGVASHIEAKGFEPFVMPSNWVDVLKDMGAPNEDEVLSASEKAGEVLSEPTADMVAALDEVWGWIVAYDMTNGLSKPDVQGFMSIMDAGGQKRGEYRNGVIMIHTDLGMGRSPLLLKVMLEEVVHHVTGAGDMSRDLQDFLFRLVVTLLK